MAARYIFRLDDASAYLNNKKWGDIEKIFDRFNIKPIVAVTPDNMDESIKHGEFDKSFWMDLCLLAKSHLHRLHPKQQNEVLHCCHFCIAP